MAQFGQLYLRTLVLFSFVDPRWVFQVNWIGMKLNSRRKLALIGFLILVLFAAIRGVSEHANTPSLLISKTLAYLTTPESIFFGLILAAIFVLAKDPNT
jgi:hypothetical protein